MAAIWQVIKDSIQGKEYDYTHGSIRKAVVLLAIPMILELGLESVFAVVDMFFVGKLGKTAIATVGLTESVVTIVYTIAIGLSTASTALIARRVGEKNMEAASKAGAQSLIIAVLSSILLSGIGIFFAPSMLKLMGASAEVLAEGALFARIMLGGSVIIVLLFLINGIFRGSGNAAIAMRSLWIASGVNIILCPLLIYTFGLGLKGAAIATTIGRGVGVLYQCYYLFGNKSQFRFSKNDFLPNRAVIVSLLNIAWPATVQFFIASASWILLAKFVSDTGGTVASAGYQIAIRNIVFFILPAWGLSNAAATLVGQNLGANKPERASQSVLYCLRYNVFFMAMVTALFVLFPSSIISLYTSETDVIAVGAQALRTIGYGYIFYGLGMVMLQALNGAGDTRTPTWIHLIGFWLIQLPLAYYLSHYTSMHIMGVFVAIPIVETLIALASWYFFSVGKWKEVKI